ncbi:MAG TPA: transglycosylase domain-containing protein, partial [Candidatus Andersenbacteria bacterium]|nr:transglycosylase domain-containing protein [Candidatus Andersenbacteria bacterium]
MQKRSSNVFFVFVLVIFTLEMFAIAYTIKLYGEFQIPDEQGLFHAKDTGLTIEDRNGNPFFTFESPARKTFVPLSKIPLYTQQAVLASEDREFYKHGALSFKGIIHALVEDITAKKLLYGGSTISQQVVKNTLLSPEKSFSRKYKEMILAFKLEKKCSKQTILEIYLNNAYFGQNAFGIEAAAQTYYGKHASDLSVGESATLAALLTAPSDLAPTHGISAILSARKNSILEYMQQQHQIASKDRSAFQQDYGTFIARKDQNTNAPYFAIMIRDQLINQFGEQTVYGSGLHVRTSLDPDLQQQVETIIQNQEYRLSRYNAHNAAAVVIDVATRDVLALAGNISWENGVYGKINMATTPRQPGSSFKPIVYATALEQNAITPASVLHDVPTKYSIGWNKSYSPQDYTKSFFGKVSAAFALANSLNVPAVEVLHMVGGDSVVAKAIGMGISNLPESAKTSLSFALGAYEVSLFDMTNAYATFAADGQYVSPHTVLEIKNKYGASVTFPPAQHRQAVSSGVSSLITSMLSDEQMTTPVFGSLLKFNEPIALKTGTSSSYRDEWTLGYSTTTAVGVWVGNSDNTP